MTQGKGTFNMEFYAYEEAPQKVIDSVIAEKAAQKQE